MTTETFRKISQEQKNEYATKIYVYIYYVKILYVYIFNHTSYLYIIYSYICKGDKRSI